MDDASLDDFLDAISGVQGRQAADAAQHIWHLTQDFFAANGFDQLIYLEQTPDHDPAHNPAG